MKTRPPVFKVRSSFRSDEAPSALVSVAFLPDWQDNKLSTAYFSLGARDQALDHAERLLDVTANRIKLDGSVAGRGQTSDRSGTYLVHDESILHFDCETDELRRIASALAVETRRFLERNPKWKTKFPSDYVAGIYSAYDEVRATNYILGEYGDPAQWLSSLVPVWKKTGRKSSYFEFGDLKVSDMILKQAMSYEDNMPVSLQVTPTYKPSL